jgi:hypothetical protein
MMLLVFSGFRTPPLVLCRARAAVQTLHLRGHLAYGRPGTFGTLDPAQQMGNACPIRLVHGTPSAVGAASSSGNAGGVVK